jgi:2,3-bisphosphoglycerate-dependent phosphoglycerate mutase
MAPSRKSNSKICIYIRHGESENNITRVISSDREKFALTDVGREAAEADGKELLALKHVDRIYSSPLMRAKETAEIIANVLDLKVEYSELLEERTLGRYNNWKFPDRAARHKMRREQIENNYPDVESYEGMAERMEEFAKGLKPGEVTIAVTHMSPIKAALGNIFKRDEAWMTGVHIENTSFTVIDHSKKGEDALLLMAGAFIPKSVIDQIG